MSTETFTTNIPPTQPTSPTRAATGPQAGGIPGTTLSPTELVQRSVFPSILAEVQQAVGDANVRPGQALTRENTETLAGDLLQIAEKYYPWQMIVFPVIQQAIAVLPQDQRWALAAQIRALAGAEIESFIRQAVLYEWSTVPFWLPVPGGAPYPVGGAPYPAGGAMYPAGGAMYPAGAAGTPPALPYYPGAAFPGAAYSGAPYGYGGGLLPFGSAFEQPASRRSRVRGRTRGDYEEYDYDDSQEDEEDDYYGGSGGGRGVGAGAQDGSYYGGASQRSQRQTGGR